MSIRGAKKKEDKPLYRAAWWFVELENEQIQLIMDCMMAQLVKFCWNNPRAERMALDEKIRGRLEREVHPLFKETKENDEQAGHGDLWARKNIKVSDTKWLELGKPKERVNRRRNLKNLLASVYTQETFQYLGLDKLEAAARDRAISAGYPDLWDEQYRDIKKEEWIDRGVPENLVKEKILWSFRRRDKELMLKHQINSLTKIRKKDKSFSNIRRTCQEETLKTLHGAWFSFMMLRAGGDKDALPPGEREDAGFFHAIPNRTAFSKKKLKKGILEVRLGDFMEPLVFPIPIWDEKESWLRKRFERACQFRQVILSRVSLEGSRREPDLSKPGRFKISIAYDVPKLPKKPICSNNTVYLAVGASYLGIVSYFGEFWTRMPRPDFHWKPLIDSVSERSKKSIKGSQSWKRRMSARANMFATMARQQKQHGQYEVVQWLLESGVHFVVTHLVVRSKEGALSDASKSERGGPLGPNWAAQNTGNIGNLLAVLTEKVKECGGSVIKREPPLLSRRQRKLPPGVRKIELARKLKEEFLAAQ